MMYDHGLASGWKNVCNWPNSLMTWRREILVSSVLGRVVHCWVLFGMQAQLLHLVSFFLFTFNMLLMKEWEASGNFIKPVHPNMVAVMVPQVGSSAAAGSIHHRICICYNPPLIIMNCTQLGHNKLDYWTISQLVLNTNVSLSRMLASYGDLGAWSSHEDFDFKWQLTRDDLVATGFDMKIIDNDTCEPDGSADGLHINILEFVITIIIELWFVLTFIKCGGPRVGSYVVLMWADNTSALSWMWYVARLHCLIAQELFHFFMACTLVSPIPFKLLGQHLAGVKNKEANALSCPQEFPMWASIIEQHSHLKDCQTYQVHWHLLSVIATIISSTETGAAYELPTTELLTLELTTLLTGSSNMKLTSSLLWGSHWGKWSWWLAGTFERWTLVIPSSSSRTWPRDLLLGTCKLLQQSTILWQRLTFPCMNQLLVAINRTSLSLLQMCLSKHRAWKQPKQKKEPYTYEMFVTLADHLLLLHKSDAKAVQYVEWVVLNWSHTLAPTWVSTDDRANQRRASYLWQCLIAQMQKNGPVDPLPSFVMTFPFWHWPRSTTQPPNACSNLSCLVIYLHVQFCFDKSPTNFTGLSESSRESLALSSALSKGALSILHCADLLGIPVNYPIGAYQPPQGCCSESVCFLVWLACSKHNATGLSFGLPKICTNMCLNIHLIMSHSNWVMATVALHNAGIHEEVIAHHLHWTVESVKFYICDYFKAIGSSLWKPFQEPFTTKSRVACHAILAFTQQLPRYPRPF